MPMIASFTSLTVVSAPSDGIESSGYLSKQEERVNTAAVSTA